MLLSAQAYQKIDRELAKFPADQRQSAIMAALAIAQDEKDWLSPDILEDVAKYIGVEPIAVQEVATFYNMFDVAPVGKHKISVCTNLPCALRSGERAGDYLKRKLGIDYRETTSEALAAEGARFDIVLNMEVVEHVDNVPLYMKSCADLVAPGGLLFSATINRTLRALALAKFGAEYVLRWLPRGTHDWNKFLTPDELKALITRNGLKILDEAGVVFHPIADEWRKSPDMGVNYMILAQRPTSAAISRP